MYCFDGSLADATSGSAKCTKCDTGFHKVAREGEDVVCMPDHIPIYVHDIKVDMGYDTTDYDMDMGGVTAFMANALHTEFYNVISRSNTLIQPRATKRRLGSNTPLLQNVATTLKYLTHAKLHLVNTPVESVTEAQKEGFRSSLVAIMDVTASNVVFAFEADCAYGKAGSRRLSDNCPTVMSWTIEADNINDAIKAELVLAREQPLFLDTLTGHAGLPVGFELSYTPTDIEFGFRVHAAMENVKNTIKLATEMRSKNRVCCACALSYAG
jgi:hypothetical protein